MFGMADAEQLANQSGDVASTSSARMSLVAGVTGLLISWVPLFGIVGWVVGPMAIVYGALGLRRATGKAKVACLIGMACGALTLAVCAAWAVLFYTGLREG